MANASHQRLQQWCAMALLECYECSPSKDLKSTVFLFLMRSSSANFSLTTQSIHKFWPMNLLSSAHILRLLFPWQYRPHFQKSNINHSMPRSVHENVSVEITQVLYSLQPNPRQLIGSQPPISHRCQVLIIHRSEMQVSSTFLFNLKSLRRQLIPPR